MPLDAVFHHNHDFCPDPVAGIFGLRFVGFHVAMVSDNTIHQQPHFSNSSIIELSHNQSW